ncbi:histidinol dehydrogenase, partial [Dermacoccus sp. CCH2-D9]|uniref:histidinol dehydrogenase n=1 Tax=Dermacoccus sp. CCH2-D9 TaxID=1768779 RepID=UPI000B292CE9
SEMCIRDSLKGVHIVDYSREALAEVADVVVTLANAEDLPAHGEAVTARFERRDEAEAGTENAPA